MFLVLLFTLLALLLTLLALLLTLLALLLMLLVLWPLVAPTPFWALGVFLGGPIVAIGMLFYWLMAISHSHSLSGTGGFHSLRSCSLSLHSSSRSLHSSSHSSLRLYCREGEECKECESCSCSLCSFSCSSHSCSCSSRSSRSCSHSSCSS